MFGGSDDWLFAKICVGIADCNHHAMWNHLGRVHFTMEPIAVSLNRQVHESHPLSLLLDTHMRFHIANNSLAQSTLVADGGQVDTCWAGTRSESLQMVYQGRRTWHIKETTFPKDTKARGLDQASTLPKYPWRDDGMLVWNAFYKFVGNYFEHFYASDEDLKRDSEVQAWAAELADSEKGGMVNGFPSRITTVAELVDLVSTIIMQVSAVHYSLNYRQYDYEALASNMPFAAYQDPEKLAAQPKITRKDILAMLPPYGAVQSQITLMFTLCAYRYDKLGEYHTSFTDLYRTSVEEVFSGHTAILSCMDTFRKDLEDAEAVITQRSAQRRIVYEGMLPSNVLNSTSI